MKVSRSLLVFSLLAVAAVQNAQASTGYRSMHALEASATVHVNEMNEMGGSIRDMIEMFNSENTHQNVLKITYPLPYQCTNSNHGRVKYGKCPTRWFQSKSNDDIDLCRCERLECVLDNDHDGTPHPRDVKSCFDSRSSESQKRVSSMSLKEFNRRTQHYMGPSMPFDDSEKEEQEILSIRKQREVEVAPRRLVAAKYWKKMCAAFLTEPITKEHARAFYDQYKELDDKYKPNDKLMINLARARLDLAWDAYTYVQAKGKVATVEAAEALCEFPQRQVNGETVVDQNQFVPKIINQLDLGRLPVQNGYNDNWKVSLTRPIPTDGVVFRAEWCLPSDIELEEPGCEAE